MLREVLQELKRLDTTGDTIKPTVRNLNIINSISRKLTNLVLTDKYLASGKEYVQTFNTITTMQNDYWASVNEAFTPKTLLKEIKKQNIALTVKGLTEVGIGTNVSLQIEKLLKTNITTGGSYQSLTDQLREMLTDTEANDGILSRYAKQIVTDAINQYNRQYTQIVASDLGFEWYAYRNSDIPTTRPFCDAMTDKRYFHITEVPNLLKGRYCCGRLMYTDKKSPSKRKLPVPLYDKTGMPQGMRENTDASNFLTYAGGYNCRHQIQPVPELNVPKARQNEVYATAAYKSWKKKAATG